MLAEASRRLGRQTATIERSNNLRSSGIIARPMGARAQVRKLIGAEVLPLSFP